MTFTYLLTPKIIQEDTEYNLNPKTTLVDVMKTNSWSYKYFIKNLISDKTCYYFQLNNSPNENECSRLTDFYWKRVIKCENEVIICK